jgi:hypothetical protein
MVEEKGYYIEVSTVQKHTLDILKCQSNVFVELVNIRNSSNRL